MGVEHLLPYPKENNKTLIQKVKDDKYRPNPVRRVEIPKEEKGKVKFLGFSFYENKDGMRLRVHHKAIAKMKLKVKEHTERNNGYEKEKRINKLKRYIRGWINYFKIAHMKQLMIRTDEWMRGGR